MSARARAGDSHGIGRVYRGSEGAYKLISLCCTCGASHLSQFDIKVEHTLYFKIVRAGFALPCTAWPSLGPA